MVLRKWLFQIWNSVGSAKHPDLLIMLIYEINAEIMVMTKRYIHCEILSQRVIKTSRALKMKWNYLFAPSRFSATQIVVVLYVVLKYNMLMIADYIISGLLDCRYPPPPLNVNVKQIQAQMAALPLSYSTADGRSQLHSLTFILLCIPVVNQSQRVFFFSPLSSYLPLTLSFVKTLLLLSSAGAAHPAAS